MVLVVPLTMLPKTPTHLTGCRGRFTLHITQLRVIMSAGGLCQAIKHRVTRMREPTQKLKPRGQTMDYDWLIPDVLPKGVSIMYGPPKSGRTSIAFELGLIVAAHTGGHVHYFDLNSNVRHAMWRLKRAQHVLKGARGLVNVHVKHHPKSFQSSTHPPALIIIDTFTRMAQSMPAGGWTEHHASCPFHAAHKPQADISMAAGSNTSILYVETRLSDDKFGFYLHDRRLERWIDNIMFVDSHDLGCVYIKGNRFGPSKFNYELSLANPTGTPHVRAVIKGLRGEWRTALDKPVSVERETEVKTHVPSSPKYSTGSSGQNVIFLEPTNKEPSIEFSEKGVTEGVAIVKSSLASGQPVINISVAVPPPEQPVRGTRDKPGRTAFMIALERNVHNELNKPRVMLTRPQIAELIGASKGSVSRAIKSLMDQGKVCHAGIRGCYMRAPQGGTPDPTEAANEVTS